MTKDGGITAACKLQFFPRTIAMEQETYHFTVNGPQEGMRLDQFLTASLQDRYSRSEIQKWIREGLVQIDGEPVLERSKKLLENQSIQAVPRTIPENTQEPVELDFQVIFEDKHLAVIHKPPGIAVHPGPGDASITLLHGILHRWPHLKGQGSRPGIVHRLDKPTEGLLLIALDPEVQWKLSRQFQERSVTKEYIAYLLSTPAETEGRLDFPLMRDRVDRRKRTVHSAGRDAVTLYRMTDVYRTRKGRKLCRVEIQLITGRTHQIRAHFAHIGCPVVGDDLYSRSSREFYKFGLLLLAARLGFHHPVTGKEMEFELPEPDRFLDFARKAEFY